MAMDARARGQPSKAEAGRSTPDFNQQDEDSKATCKTIHWSHPNQSTHNPNKLPLPLPPHNHLPSELLARVFLELQGGHPLVLPPDLSKAPWILQRVCSWWRRVAWETGGLWGDVVVADGRAGRAALAWIPRIWSRAPSFPVSLTMGTPFAWEDSVERDVLAPYSHRMRRLSLYAHPDSFPSILVGHSYPFDALESLVLKIYPDTLYDDEDFRPKKGPPLTLFTTATQLRRVTFSARSINSSFDYGFYKLPWTQLTHLSFHLVRIPSEKLEQNLCQCSNLISLTFTSILSNPHPHGPDTDTPTILLPRLKSLTVVLERGYSYRQTFNRLRVPSLTEATFDNTATSDFRFDFDHTTFLAMIERSGATLTSLSLLGRVREWTPHELLGGLPGLAGLVVSESIILPDSIFDAMLDGEILPALEHLQCSTRSPARLLQLLGHQCGPPPSSEHRVISTAHVSYDVDAADEGLVREQYERLQPMFESRGMEVMLERVVLRGLMEYWEGLM